MLFVPPLGVNWSLLAPELTVLLPPDKVIWSSLAPVVTLFVPAAAVTVSLQYQ